MEKFNTREVREVTREDGTPFARATIEYFGLSRTDLVDLEREFVGALNARLADAESKLGK